MTEWLNWIHGLLSLASFIQHHVFKAHQCCSVYPYFFFLRLSYFIVWIDHVSWIHSSVDGQLHHFQFWAPVNNAALNIRVQVLVWIILSLQHPSVSSLGQYHLNHQGSVLHKKQDIISKAGSSGSWARVSGGLSLYLLCDLKLWIARLLQRRRQSVPIPPLALPSSLPQIAKSSFLRKEGAVLCNPYKASVLSAWFMSPHLTHSHWTYVCAFPQPCLSCVNWFSSKLMRPNSQAMSVWIKGTWESLFMCDSRKLPVSCSSELPAESMLERWGLQSPVKAGVCSHSILPAVTNTKPADSQVHLRWWFHFCKFSLKTIYAALLIFLPTPKSSLWIKIYYKIQNTSIKVV